MTSIKIVTFGWLLMITTMMIRAFAFPGDYGEAYIHASALIFFLGQLLKYLLPELGERATHHISR